MTTDRERLSARVKALEGQREHLERIEAVARRACMAMPHYLDIIDHTEFDIAMTELRRLLGITEDQGWPS